LIGVNGDACQVVPVTSIIGHDRPQSSPSVPDDGVVLLGDQQQPLRLSKIPVKAGRPVARQIARDRVASRDISRRGNSDAAHSSEDTAAWVRPEGKFG
jgi:hypothetical protein